MYLTNEYHINMLCFLEQATLKGLYINVYKYWYLNIKNHLVLRLKSLSCERRNSNTKRETKNNLSLLEPLLRFHEDAVALCQGTLQSTQEYYFKTRETGIL